MEWYVVQDKESGKYADGFGGWDGCVHTKHQIFPEDAMPFEPNDDMNFILVGDGEKPTINRAKTLSKPKPELTAVEDMLDFEKLQRVILWALHHSGSPKQKGFIFAAGKQVTCAVQNQLRQFGVKVMDVAAKAELDRLQAEKDRLGAKCQKHGKTINDLLAKLREAGILEPPNDPPERESLRHECACLLAGATEGPAYDKAQWAIKKAGVDELKATLKLLKGMKSEGNEIMQREGPEAGFAGMIAFGIMGLLLLVVGIIAVFWAGMAVGGG